MNETTLDSNMEMKIINAAIECIEKYGIEGATSRRIAQAAGVNGAAINYYFRSKEALIARVVKQTLKNAFDWEDFDRIPSASPRETIVNIYETIITGACDYPGVTRFHFTAILNGDRSSTAWIKFNEFFETLYARVRQEYFSLSDEDLKLALAQISSAALMAALVPSFFEKSLGFDLHTPRDRRLFLERLVDGLLRSSNTP